MYADFCLAVPPCSGEAYFLRAEKSAWLMKLVHSILEGDNVIQSFRGIPGQEFIWATNVTGGTPLRLVLRASDDGNMATFQGCQLMFSSRIPLERPHSPLPSRYWPVVCTHCIAVGADDSDPSLRCSGNRMLVGSAEIVCRLCAVDFNARSMLEHRTVLSRHRVSCFGGQWYDVLSARPV